MVHQRLEQLLAEGRVASCHMTALEFLNNAPDPRSYEVLWRVMHGHRWVDVTEGAMERALDVHPQLARTSRHATSGCPI